MPTVTTNVQEVVDRWKELSRPENGAELAKLLSPALLMRLDEQDMETLLGLLPQIGALRGRTPGGLRIVSAGYQCHIQGDDSYCPHPVDFFVRASGVFSSITLPIRIAEADLSKCADLRLGGDFLKNLRSLNQVGVSVCDLELVMQKMYRPGVPNCFHWTTAGGIPERGEDAQFASVRELCEEVGGLREISRMTILKNREYQGGNIPEFHSATAVLCVGEPVPKEGSSEEGVTDYTCVPLGEMESWYDREHSLDPFDSDCNYPSGKAEHAFLKFLRFCEQNEIR